MTGYINSEFMPQAAAFEAALTALYRQYYEIERRIEAGNDDTMLEQADDRLHMLEADVALARIILFTELLKVGYKAADIEQQIAAFKLEIEARVK